MNTLYLINILLLILAGILAISGLIVAKKPNARELIDKLLPFQALIGVVLLAFGLVNLLRSLSGISYMFRTFPGIVTFLVLVTSILLGFMFGMPQIAKWLPGNSAAEQKGQQLTAKLAPYQVIIGLVGLGAAALSLLYYLRIL
jgi:hypothetical protein